MENRQEPEGEQIWGNNWLNQAPIPSHYLISCTEDYTVAPTTINPILRRTVAILGSFAWRLRRLASDRLPWRHAHSHAFVRSRFVLFRL
jgi:hypothetical protein